MAILVACICIINIILWIVFLVRFKKLFSTDKIINTTTEKMNKLVTEIDKATDRNIFLTDASSKKIQKQISYDLLYPNNENDNRTETNNEQNTLKFNTELISNTISQLQDILLPENEHLLDENEKKIGNALLEMMLNWEDIFKYLGSKKFNKSCVLQFIREYTDLPTKEIREGMKKYKELYLFTKEKLINQ